MSESFLVVLVGKRFVRHVESVMVGNQAIHAERFLSEGDAQKAKERVLELLRGAAERSPHEKARWRKKTVSVRRYTIETVSETPIFPEL